MLSSDKIKTLQAIEQKILWLSTWMIHHANNIRPNPDGLKIGGHQASSASCVTILTALYFAVLRSQDKISIKPHASPIFHAIQYLLGNQKVENLINFRGLGGAQSYPSRTKDYPNVDFSTGSVGLGVSITLFASLLQDYLAAHKMLPQDHQMSRMIALLGDAELDEGNIYEALLEGWKHNVRNLWWIVDYNRQSLDNVTKNQLNKVIADQFKSYGWRVIELKYGQQLQALFQQPGGHLVKDWLEKCPHDLYSALVYKQERAWRDQLRQDIKDPQLDQLLLKYNDQQLHAIMANLGGHDFTTLLQGFEQASDSQPTCFIAHTIKGYQLPFAGHKDNHAGLLNAEQIKILQAKFAIPTGQEWSPSAGMSQPKEEIQRFIQASPYQQKISKTVVQPLKNLPNKLPDIGYHERQSTQEAFGRLMTEISKLDDQWVNHVVTTSPDVTVSTNLGGWVNRRSIFAKNEQEDLFRQLQIPSAQRWQPNPSGQHVELGIAENNLFTALAAFGLAEPLFGQQMIPIGTLYDPFIARGLDAMIYACYQDARFILVSTPSGISLSSEGGAHQSIITPLIGISQDNLNYYEPAFADELAIILCHAIKNLHHRPTGNKSAAFSTYLRLSTKSIAQPKRNITPALENAVIQGGYWLKEPALQSKLAIISCGVITAEAMAAWEQVSEDCPEVGLLVVTSPDQLYAGWDQHQDNANEESHISQLLSVLAPSAHLVTVIDGHPATLTWMGSVHGHHVQSLGVTHFGQSGSVSDLYRLHHIDRQSILDACAQALVKMI